MVHVSKYPLDSFTQKELFYRFRKSISSLGDADAVSIFFSDFLSPIEELVLAKRFTIAVLLLHGTKPQDIKRKLHVSNSAVGAVSSWLKNAQPKTIAMLERIIKENKWEEFIDAIMQAVDALPPGHGTNWSQVWKDRLQRNNERNARKTLR